MKPDPYSYLTPDKFQADQRFKGRNKNITALKETMGECFYEPQSEKCFSLSHKP